ncbi:FAD-binding oxidoreductase [Variovorax sp. PCZ-1]|uniref:FAD-binding oxidoreductase n=1 Tax=Variovorax sp. PCZ-1 TaxID=2835533 RepID=UPI001BCB695F|nr:FAD-binding oxidoreductase [Variovorax sp. PCZ-1]MBS7806539.1 FAD-binding oxidoreductase [Variovorax sp. PCZ-1]
MRNFDYFIKDIEAIPHTRDAHTLAVKSKDYYWYSPILKAELDDKMGDVMVSPRTEAEVIQVAAACAKHRLNITIRGGGTGNYGQCVPLEGGVILDITQLNRVINISKGQVTCEAGILIADLEKAVRADNSVEGGQEILMFPSTRDIATIGGFIAGGYAGAGSVRNGILKDAGNVTMIRVVTLEEKPRIIELKDADIQKVHHAYGTNGIITALTLSLKPAVDWVHHIALFDSYSAALRFGCEATEAIGSSVDAFLITAVERRIAPYYEAEFGARFPANKDAVFSMVNPNCLPAWRALVAKHGGHESMAFTEETLKKEKLSPAFECAYNHTTLIALKQDKSWTNLQTVAPWTAGQGIDITLVEKQMARWGDEVLMHHEFGRQFGGCVAFGLPLVSYFDKTRLYEIISEFEQDGCMVFDNHVYTIEDGGMKEIDHNQIDFKRVADPYGLMNPGKTRGWVKPSQQ